MSRKYKIFKTDEDTHKGAIIEINNIMIFNGVRGKTITREKFGEFTHVSGIAEHGDHKAEVWRYKKYEIELKDQHGYSKFIEYSIQIVGGPEPGTGTAGSSGN